MSIFKWLFPESNKPEHQFKKLSERISRLNIRAARELPAVEDIIMDLGRNVTSWARLTVTTGDRRKFIRQLILEQASKHGLDLKSLAQYLGLALFYERGRNGESLHLVKPKPEPLSCLLVS